MKNPVKAVGAPVKAVTVAPVKAITTSLPKPRIPKPPVVSSPKIKAPRITPSPVPQIKSKATKVKSVAITRAAERKPAGNINKSIIRQPQRKVSQPAQAVKNQTLSKPAERKLKSLDQRKVGMPSLQSAANKVKAKAITPDRARAERIVQRWKSKGLTSDRAPNQQDRKDNKWTTLYRRDNLSDKNAKPYIGRTLDNRLKPRKKEHERKLSEQAGKRQEVKLEAIGRARPKIAPVVEQMLIDKHGGANQALANKRNEVAKAKLLDPFLGKPAKEIVKENTQARNKQGKTS